MVGVNAYVTGGEPPIPMLRIDEKIMREQIENLARLKQERDPAAVARSLRAIEEAARNDRNLMPPIIDAAKSYCTEQEICDVLRAVFGQHRDRPEF